MISTYTRVILLSLFIAGLLTGCLYPKSELAKNQIPNEAQLDAVQSAVEGYMETTGGLVPIRTKPAETPVFEKYVIDFDSLKQQQLLTEIPGNAFENGGIYQYTIITPETDPRVRLIDIQTADAIRQVNVKLDIYRSKHLYPPFGEEIVKGLYTIDYEKLDLKAAPYAVSPFTKENLPIIMDTHGQLYIDYRIDLTYALNEFKHSYKEGDDIRYILPENYPFVPAFSLPYTISNDEPVFLQ